MLVEAIQSTVTLHLYLGSGDRLAAESVKGIQGVGIIASSKHLIANEQQEGYRNQEKTVPDRRRTVETILTNLDDRTLHEYYL
ncbi:hypothetical protein SS1G_02806 [Sclerotinia sclerotiorum 1980 UF-70]|uniref:Uncharacterized protein n=1 Tax=Sclerotinia sclerotiorum (strain ATCC 18683 / 1980 / Ss-1) TaxID=665079 RepID=A7EBX0_SCLS1|nr:hypothetical protein SS1G_02806 [Sclerotinia sclerotiorum 1980 UF-70]EDN99948.1 hypothetical protein SS1G_02806 [Sclerotinia sclerotiorum 1980 UF-70]